MRILFAAALCVSVFVPHRLAAADTYPQLISTQYPNRAKLPADFAEPVSDYSFLDKAKLPAGAKLLSAANAGDGKIWVVTDKGAFRTGADGYVPLAVGPQHPEPGQPAVKSGV